MKDRVDNLLSIILLVAIIAAIGTTIYVIAAPKERESFTDFFILGSKGVAADYPDRLFVGTGYPMYIGIGNHEYRNVTYTIETWLAQMDFNEVTNTSNISRMDRIDQFEVILSHNETETRPFNLMTPATGYNQVKFLLFNESIPSENITGMDRINASYRDLHLWVTVREKPKLV